MSLRAECSPTGLREATDVARVRCVKQLGVLHGRRWKVLLVTAVAVFMAFLDVTIVNIAFPDRGPTSRPPRWPGCRGCSTPTTSSSRRCSCRPGGWPTASGGGGCSSPGLGLFLAASAACGLAPSVPVLVAARVVQAVGAAALLCPRRSRCCCPSSRSSSARPPPPCGARRAPSRRRPGRRWAACSWTPRLALGLLREPRVRRARAGARAAAAARDARPGPRRRARRGRHRAAGRRRRPAVAGDRRGARLGLGSSAPCSAPSAPRCCSSSRCSSGARRARPHPVVDPSLFGVRSFAVANAGVLLFSVGFYALLLAQRPVPDLGLGLVGAAGRLGASRPGPLTAAVTAALGGRVADRFGQRVVALPGGAAVRAGLRRSSPPRRARRRTTPASSSRRAS